MVRPERDAGANVGGAFGARLRVLREARQRTQQDVAAALGVQRATLSQWETGRHLPSEENAAQLDDLLGAGGELISLAEHARSDDSPAPSGDRRLSLREVHTSVGRALVARLRRDGAGRPLGWSHDFEPALPPTPLSSAFAIKALALIEAPYVDLAALAERLVAGREKSGGWGARRMRARPESSAVVLDALTRIGGARRVGDVTVDVDVELGLIENMIDDQSSTKPRATASTYVLATVLEIVARLRPGSAFANRLTDMLLALERDSAWPEKRVDARESRLAPQLSTAHTARAVIALAVVRDTEPPGGEDADDHSPQPAERKAEREAHTRARTKAGTAVGRGVQWLARNAQDHPIRENLYAIDKQGDVGDLEIRHMTPALIARALALAEEPDVPRIQRVLDALWTQYDPDRGMWLWPNGDVPPWLQYDALAATRVAHGRTTSVAVPRS